MTQASNILSTGIVIYYMKLKSRLSVCLHLWNADNSVVSAMIKTGLARKESCVFKEH